MTLFITDKDECTWRIHNCSHQSYCRNTEGGFQCVCPKGHELVAGVNCIPDDMTRWTTPKYLLKDIMDGVWSRLLAVGAAAVIVLSLLTISVVCCKRKCEKWAEERELKRLAYEGKRVLFRQPLKNKGITDRIKNHKSLTYLMRYNKQQHRQTMLNNFKFSSLGGRLRKVISGSSD